MPTAHNRERLRRILDLSDRLERVRRQMRERVTDTASAELAGEVREIAGSLVTSGMPGALGRLAADHRLGPHEQMVLLLLLHKRIESSDGALSGRELLSTVFPSSYGILSGAALLEEGAGLRESHAIQVVGPTREEPLDTYFCVADPLFRDVERETRPLVDRPNDPAPYRSHWEHLADLGKLTALLLRRANAIFEIDPFGGRAFPDTEPAERLSRRIDSLTASIRVRVERTRGAPRFPLMRLSRNLKLSEAEQIIIVGLLVQECYYGSPGLEAVDCVKMVSESHEELLRNRSLLAPDGRLRGAGLIDIEEPVDDRELTGEVLLARWAASGILGEKEQAGSTPIGPDTRLEFHEYLKGLGDSDQFFRDLGS